MRAAAHTAHACSAGVGAPQLFALLTPVAATLRRRTGRNPMLQTKPGVNLAAPAAADKQAAQARALCPCVQPRCSRVAHANETAFRGRL